MLPIEQNEATQVALGAVINPEAYQLVELVFGCHTELVYSECAL